MKNEKEPSLIEYILVLVFTAIAVLFFRKDILKEINKKNTP